MEKKKLDTLTKAKLIYSLEIGIISLVFIVVGILDLVGVIPPKGKVLFRIFNFISMGGATWMIVDLVWTLTSKKRRAKQCLLDKFLSIPVACYLYSIDIYFFTIKDLDTVIRLRQVLLGCLLLLVGCIYVFQAIYHFFKPLPMVIEAAKAEEEELLKQQEEANKANNEQNIEENEKESENDGK